MTLIAEQSLDPLETKDFTLDWEARLGSDTISSSSWTIPSGLAITNSSNTTTTTTVWLAGGMPGVHYEVINEITTSGSRTLKRTIVIRCLPL